MNSVIVTKVYDRECPICDTMARFDSSVLEGFPEASFQQITFDDLREKLNTNQTAQRIYTCLEKYAVSASYEIDFPTYVFLTKTGKYLGNLQGALDLREFREGVKSILSQNPTE